nr:hypothetical protein [Tanacetum cinerariifolium]
MEGGRVMVDYWRRRGRRSVGNIGGSSVLGDDAFRDDLRFHGIGSGLRETPSHAVLVKRADIRSFWVARFLMTTPWLECDAANFSLVMVMLAASFERFSGMTAILSTIARECFRGM